MSGDPSQERGKPIAASVIMSSSKGGAGGASNITTSSTIAARLSPNLASTAQVFTPRAMQQPDETIATLEDYPLSVLYAQRARLDGATLKYLYTGAALRTAAATSVAATNPDGSTTARRFDYIPDGFGTLELYLVENAPPPTVVSNTNAGNTEEAEKSSANAFGDSFVNTTSSESHKQLLVQYTGQFDRGKKHGKGMVTVPAKYTLSCLWNTDIPNLSMECVFCDTMKRTTYLGLLSMISDGTESTTSREGFFGLEWAAGVMFMPDSAGEMVYPDRKRYCGQWQCGQRHGFGILLDPVAHHCFVGGFEYDAKQGSGTLYFEQHGATFCGMWHEDEVEGTGGLHLPGKNTSTIQGMGWNDRLTECREATILRSRNVNGVWEPLFINFDNLLATSTSEYNFNISSNSRQNNANSSGENGGGVITAASPSTRNVQKESVLDGVNVLLHSNHDFTALLSLFQRCFYFLYGCCGSSKDCCGGGVGYRHGSSSHEAARTVLQEIQDEVQKAQLDRYYSRTNLLSWCAAVQSPHQCIHKMRGKTINSTTLRRALDDLTSFIFSVRLRLQSFVAMHPLACEFDTAQDVLRLAWQHVHALVSSLMYNIIANVDRAEDAKFQQSVRRCEECTLTDFIGRQVLEDEGTMRHSIFQFDEDEDEEEDNQVVKKEVVKKKSKSGEEQLPLEDLLEAVLEQKCVRLLTEFGDFDLQQRIGPSSDEKHQEESASQKDFNEESSLNSLVDENVRLFIGSVQINGTSGGPLLSFPSHRVSASLEKQFTLLRRSVLALARLCGGQITTSSSGSNYDSHSPSPSNQQNSPQPEHPIETDCSIHLQVPQFPTSRQRDIFMKLLMYCALQVEDPHFYSRLHYLRIICTEMEPKYPTISSARNGYEACYPQSVGSTADAGSRSRSRAGSARYADSDQDDFSLEMNDVDLFCVSMLIDAVEGLGNVYPSVRDHTQYALAKKGISTTSDVSPGNLDASGSSPLERESTAALLGSLKLNVSNNVSLSPARRNADGTLASSSRYPLLAIDSIIAECRYVLGRGLFEKDFSLTTTSSVSEDRPRTPMPVVQRRADSAEATSPALSYTASPTFRKNSGATNTGNPSFDPSSPLMHDDENVLEPFSLWMLQCVNEFLQIASVSPIICPDVAAYSPTTNPSPGSNTYETNAHKDKSPMISPRKSSVANSALLPAGITDKLVTVAPAVPSSASAFSRPNAKGEVFHELKFCYHKSPSDSENYLFSTVVQLQVYRVAQLLRRCGIELEFLSGDKAPIFTATDITEDELLCRVLLQKNSDMNVIRGAKLPTKGKGGEVSTPTQQQKNEQFGGGEKSSAHLEAFFSSPDPVEKTEGGEATGEHRDTEEDDERSSSLMFSNNNSLIEDAKQHVQLGLLPGQCELVLRSVEPIVEGLHAGWLLPLFVRRQLSEAWSIGMYSARHFAKNASHKHHVRASHR